MKLRWVVFAGCTLMLLTFASSASAGCWKCDGCCESEVRGQIGSGACTAIQACVNACACTHCRVSGSSCPGTAEPECDNSNGICEQHQTRRDEALPRVVPNGDPIDLQWLISPPALPEGDAGVSGGACA